MRLLILFHKGMKRPPHIHDTTRSTFYFVSGSGDVLLENKSVPFKAGTHMIVPAGEAHGFTILEDTVMLAIQDNTGIIKPDGTIDFRYK